MASLRSDLSLPAWTRDLPPGYPLDDVRSAPLSHGELAKLSVEEFRATVREKLSTFAKSPSTVRSWSSFWRTWKSHCQSVGHPPTPVLLEDVVSLCEAKDYARSSVYVLFCALSAFQFLVGQPNVLATESGGVVRETLLKAARTRQQSLPKASRVRLAQTFAADQPSLKHVRDAAVIRIIFDTRLYLNDIVRLRFEDVRQDDQGWRMAVRNAQDALTGELRWLSIDAVRSIEDWSVAMGRTYGPICCALNGREGRTTDRRLGAGSLWRSLRDTSVFLGINPSLSSPAALRRGGAIEALTQSGRDQWLRLSQSHYLPYGIQGWTRKRDR